MTVLVCDDDRDIVQALEIYLRGEGYDVLTAMNGAEALERVRDHEVHLILLDVMMPVMDGLRALMKLREQRNIPVILLTAKSEEADKVLGLNIGADDYVTKPFSPLELLARVKSQLRRYTSLGSVVARTGLYRTGGLIVDDERKEVTVDGEPVRLTPVEYGILCMLIREAGRVFSIGQIYEQVWQEPAFSPENTVAVHIRRIREKIEINPKEPKYLKVVWGIGYKVEKY